MSKKINITKEEIEEFYIKGLHTVEECAKHFGMGKTAFYRYMRKYGVERSKEDKSKVYSRAQNLEENKEKTRKTNLARYGAATKTAANSPISFIDDEHFSVNGKEYTVEWLKQKYLGENLSKDEIEKELGTTYAVATKILSHYKVTKSFGQRYEIIEKRVREKYGVVSTLELEDVKKKSRQTSLEKYGETNPMKSKEVQLKANKTMLERYGAENYAQTKEYRDKIYLTNLKKYNAPNHTQQNMSHLDIWRDDNLFREYILGLSEKPTAYELMEFFNLTDRTVVYEKIHDCGLEDAIQMNPARSHYEDEIIQFLRKMGINNIIMNDRSILGGKEIDIYLPDYKIGIEFNGTYWHSDVREEYQDHGGRSLTHQNKSLLAESKGIFLFHIFEYEWRDSAMREKIKNRLRAILGECQQEIYARKCELVDLEKNEKKEFLEDNHTQGNDHSSLYFGLKYKGELVCCMTFARPKSGKYTWELSRFCNKAGYFVFGGASRLLNHFVKKLAPGDTISSYNDITKTKGDLYKKLGFDCVSVNSPNYIWYNFGTKDIRTRYQEQEGGEAERMHSLGYHRVCDCGTKTWVYTVK